MRPSIRIGLVALVGGLVIGAFAKVEHARAGRATHEVARITQKMKTVCVGRFTIDLPKGAQVELTSARIGGFGISTFEESVDEFRGRLAQYEAEVGAKPDRHGGNHNLESVKEIRTASGLVGKIFVHSRTVTEGTAGNGIENEHFRYEGVAVESLVHGNGVSVDLGSDYYPPDKIEKLNRLIGQLVPNRQSEALREAGFCLDRAYVREPLKTDQREQITMSASLPSHPDINLMLILVAGTKPDEDGLLKRGDAAEAELPLMDRFRISRLRAAPRRIGGLSGEELVRRGIEANGSQVYSFWWEVKGNQNDVLTPHLEFTMTTGKDINGPVPTSMSEEAALRLWDRISSSIRLHPMSERKRDAAAEPSRPKVGHALYRFHLPVEAIEHNDHRRSDDSSKFVGMLGGRFAKLPALSQGRIDQLGYIPVFPTQGELE